MLLNMPEIRKNRFLTALQSLPAETLPSVDELTVPAAVEKRVLADAAAMLGGNAARQTRRNALSSGSAAPRTGTGFDRQQYASRLAASRRRSSLVRTISTAVGCVLVFVLLIAAIAFRTELTDGLGALFGGGDRETGPVDTDPRREEKPFVFRNENICLKIDNEFMQNADGSRSVRLIFSTPDGSPLPGSFILCDSIEMLFTPSGSGTGQPATVCGAYAYGKGDLAILAGDFLAYREEYEDSSAEAFFSFRFCGFGTYTLVIRDLCAWEELDGDPISADQTLFTAIPLAEEISVPLTLEASVVLPTPTDETPAVFRNDSVILTADGVSSVDKNGNRFVNLALASADGTPLPGSFILCDSVEMVFTPYGASDTTLCASTIYSGFSSICAGDMLAWCNEGDSSAEGDFRFRYFGPGTYTLTIRKLCAWKETDPYAAGEAGFSSELLAENIVLSINVSD